jgi:hypothetical protein
MFVAQATAISRGGAGDEGSDQHRQRGEDRDLGRRLSRAIRHRPSIIFGLLLLGDNVINALLSIRIGQAGP